MAKLNVFTHLLPINQGLLSTYTNSIISSEDAPHSPGLRHQGVTTGT